MANKPYDTLYQDWLKAKQSGDYSLADTIRSDFERLHGLTIIAEGDMPMEGVTTQRMKASAWHKKYGTAKVGEIIATQDSKVGKGYKGTPILK